jgi:alanyl-tRNA synthetase
VRAGGKHNDLDNVGYTARHLTFFEMLGNFSFGDYFKERAIELRLEPDHQGIRARRTSCWSPSITPTTRRPAYWKKIAGFSDDRIIRIPTSDNFWAMGDTGPCGPCSEIFIDRGEHIWGGPPGSPEEDGDRFLEFWNLVFMQFEQVTKEERVALPRRRSTPAWASSAWPRSCRASTSVFETDLFRHLIDAASSALGTGPTADNAASEPSRHRRPSALVLLPDRRRRAAVERGPRLRAAPHHAPRHAPCPAARRNEPLMWKLVPALVREMGQAYPELAAARR